MEENKTIWIWAFAVVALLLLFSSFGMGGFGMMGFGIGFGLLLMLLFLGAIIWIIVTLINTNQSNQNKLNSLTILKRRYASGEITKKQYEDMKKEIGA
ncbi:SHOCT domain-containing protein [Candidatus Woesearchaeota archaeon]|nr:SHOCT domain-containing protein [Candidatus Woesearchaeota archaeon]